MEPTQVGILALARAGDATALDAIIQSVQNEVFRLALHMLGHPEDAQDATQEILVKIVTRLSMFAGESSFTTWVYRIAANHLLTMRTRRREQQASFIRLGDDIAAGLASGAGESADQPEDALLAQEVRHHCTQGMLLCLDRSHRIALLLVLLFGVSSQEGAAILHLTPDAFRQRVSRARQRLRAFMDGRCGIFDPANPCRCARQVMPSLASGRLDPAHLVYGEHPAMSNAVFERLHAEFLELEDLAVVLRHPPANHEPEMFVQTLRDIVTTRHDLQLFTED